MVLEHGLDVQALGVVGEAAIVHHMVDKTLMKRVNPIYEILPGTKKGDNPVSWTLDDALEQHNIGRITSWLPPDWCHEWNLEVVLKRDNAPSGKMARLKFHDPFHI